MKKVPEETKSKSRSSSSPRQQKALRQPQVRMQNLGWWEAQPWGRAGAAEVREVFWALSTGAADEAVLSG